MRRVVVLGRGGAGKSVLSRRLGAVLGVPVVELDALFWRRADLEPLPAAEWRRVQADVVRRPTWVLDGDLGPHDALEVRLREADTVIVLDFSLARCTWRALLRSRERLDFWRWVLAYRRRWRPRILADVRTHAPAAELRVLRSPGQARRFLRALGDDRGRSDHRGRPGPGGGRSPDPDESGTGRSSPGGQRHPEQEDPP